VNPNHRGAVAEAAIALEAAKAGVEVLRPVADHCRYDLVFDVGGRLYRVQCKSAQIRRETVVIKLVSSWHTPAGYVRTTYSPGELDLVAAYCHETGEAYVLPFDLVAGMTGVQLRLSPPKNAQRAAIHYAADYELPGAVAQLGERSAGSRKVVGSSPISSTPPGADTTVGAHQFRNLFGHFMERAAAGEEILVTHRGRPRARLSPPYPMLRPEKRP
jgi:prevent-host-death family protein